MSPTEDRTTADDALSALRGLGARLAPDSDADRASVRGGGRGPIGRSRDERASAVKRIAVAIAVVIALALVAPSSFSYISPGHVGILIHRAGGGVDRSPLGPGIHFRNPLLSSIEEYPTFMQTLVLSKGSSDGNGVNEEINVNSQEGQPLSLDVAMSFELDPARVPALYSTFRTDIATIQHGYVKQTIRQALQEVIGTEPIADVIGPKKAEAVNRTQSLISQRLSQYGIVVKQFTVNELRAPDAVMQAINQKNVMQQQALTAQNELQKNQFQAQGDSIKAAGRAKAIMAEAEAQSRANQLLSASITPTLVQYELTKKWNGQMPMVSGGATPLIQLPAAKP